MPDQFTAAQVEAAARAFRAKNDEYIILHYGGNIADEVLHVGADGEETSVFGPADNGAIRLWLDMKGMEAAIRATSEADKARIVDEAELDQLKRDLGYEETRRRYWQNQARLESERLVVAEAQRDAALAQVAVLTADHVFWEERGELPCSADVASSWKDLVYYYEDMSDKVNEAHAKQVAVLREALTEIGNRDWVENCLDSQWASRCARTALHHLARTARPGGGETPTTPDGGRDDGE